MKNMKGRSVTLASSRNQAGEITVETGNTWRDIYKEVCFLCLSMSVCLSIYLSIDIIYVMYNILLFVLDIFVTITARKFLSSY